MGGNPAQLVLVLLLLFHEAERGLRRRVVACGLPRQWKSQRAEFLEERQTPSAASSVLTVMKIRMSEPTVHKVARRSWVWPVK